MIRRLFEMLTGTPWTTTRSCTAEFGPPPGARYARQLAAYSDAELIAHGHHIIAEIQAQQATQRATRPAPGRPAGTRARSGSEARTAGVRS